MGRWWKLQDVEEAGHGVCALEVPLSVSSHFFICVLPPMRTLLSFCLPTSLLSGCHELTALLCHTFCTMILCITSDLKQWRLPSVDQYF